MKDYKNDKSISVTTGYYSDLEIRVKNSKVFKFTYRLYNGINTLYSLNFGSTTVLNNTCESLNEQDFKYIKDELIKKLNVKINSPIMCISKNSYTTGHIELLKAIGFTLIEPFINSNTGNLLHVFYLENK